MDPNELTLYVLTGALAIGGLGVCWALVMRWLDLKDYARQLELERKQQEARHARYSSKENS